MFSESSLAITGAIVGAIMSITSTIIKSVVSRRSHRRGTTDEPVESTKV
jgi:hypothetical protein